MFKKFTYNWRKLEKNLNYYIIIFIIQLLEIFLFITFLIFFATLYGLIISFCWNNFICYIFNLKNLTIPNGFLLFFTINCLKINYTNLAKDEYWNYKNKIFKYNNSKIAKIICILIVILIEFLFIYSTILHLMFCWNVVLPYILNINLIKINIIQATYFAFILNLILKTPT